jgi:hypothetical protein
MAGTYVDMQTRIADDLVDTAVTTAQIKNAILTAVSDYDSARFFFNQKTATFSTVAAQEYYTTAALSDIPNIVSIDSALITYSGYKSQLVAVDYSTMDAEQDGTITSAPYWYAYYGQQIRLFPIPDAVYTVTLSYLYKFTTLSADSDTNAWMTDGEEMIRQAAKRRLALDTLRDPELAAICKSLEEDAYDGLLMETRLKLPNKKLAVPAMGIKNSYNIYTGR